MISRLSIAVAFALAGCSFSGSIGANKVSAADLENQVAAQAADNDLNTTSVDCPTGLEATVGAVAECEIIANDLKYTAKATTTEVNNEKDSVLFDLQVRPPATVPKQTLETEVAKIVEANSGTKVGSVTCVDEMVGTTGTAVDCAVESTDGEVLDLVATVTEADFLNVNFSLDEKS